MLLDLTGLDYNIDGREVKAVDFPDNFPSFAFFVSDKGSTVYFKYNDVFFGVSFLDWNLKDFFDYVLEDSGYSFSGEEFINNLNKAFSVDGYCCGKSSDFFLDYFSIYFSGLFTLVLSVMYEEEVISDYLHNYFYFSSFVCIENDCFFIDFNSILDFSTYYLESVSFDNIIFDFVKQEVIVNTVFEDEDIKVF